MAVAACGAEGATGAADGRPAVAAAFFPLAEVARGIGGDDVAVTTLVSPGQEAHDFEPTPKQMAHLADADVVLYLGGFQPALDTALAELDGPLKVDLGDGLVVDEDPHIWLDPQRMQAMAERAATAVAERDPAHAVGYRQRSADLDAELAALDRRYAARLAACDSTHVVTSHDALGYLAERYGLTTVPIAGISPQDEPSPQELEDVAASAREHDVTTVFFEDHLPDDLARAIADEVGIDTAAIDTAESPSQAQLDDGIGYVQVMDANLATLATGLGCTSTP